MSSPLLELEHADIGYGEKLIVTNVSLQITPTSRIGLLGMNGAGKSTLIKSLVGDLQLLQGTRNDSELLNIGYFAQHQMDALDGNASPMLQLARIADKRSVKPAYALSSAVSALVANVWTRQVKASLVANVRVWLWP